MDPTDEAFQLSVLATITGGTTRRQMVDAVAAVMGSDLLKEVPGLRHFMAARHDYLAVRDHLLAQKIYAFVRQVETNADETTMRKFREDCLTDSAYRSRVVVQLVATLDRIDAEQKAAVLANLFDAYLTGHIAWQRFVHLGFCLEQVNGAVFQYIHELAATGFVTHGENREWEPMVVAAGIGMRTGTTFTINSFGRDLYTLGIRPLHPSSAG